MAEEIPPEERKEWIKERAARAAFRLHPEKELSENKWIKWAVGDVLLPYLVEHNPEWLSQVFGFNLEKEDPLIYKDAVVSFFKGERGREVFYGESATDNPLIGPRFAGKLTVSGDQAFKRLQRTITFWQHTPAPPNSTRFVAGNFANYLRSKEIKFDLDYW